MLDRDYISDWVVIELRDKNDTNVLVSSRAALLHKTGKITDIDGISPVFFPSVAANNYYILIRHRNHFPIISTLPTSLYGQANIDFRTMNTFSGICTGQVEVNPGLWAMPGGDINQDNDINGDDKAFWNTENGNFGLYNPSDLNLDGDINGDDKIIWNRNNGTFSCTPDIEE